MAGLPHSIYDDFDPALPAEPIGAGTSGGSIYDEFERSLEIEKIRSEAAAQTGSGLGKEFRSGFYGTVGSAAKGIGALVGSETIEDYGDRTNAYAQGLSEGSGLTQSLYDIEDVGDAVSYAGKTIANAAGSTIPSLVGGGGAGALAARGLGIAASRGAVGGAFGVSAAAGTGQNIEAQEDQAGERDLLSAGVLGAAAGGLEVAGGLTGGALKALAGKGAQRGFVRQAGRSAVEEAAVETGQQFTEELSRRAVDEEFDVLGSESRARLGEAAVAGALGGGALGGGISAITREKKNAVPSADPEAAGTDPTVSAAADERGEPVAEGQRLLPAPGPTDQLVTEQLEDLRPLKGGTARPTETADPIAMGVSGQASPAIDLSVDPAEFFTGATPETFRPISSAMITQRIRGDLPLDKNVRQIVDDVVVRLDPYATRNKKLSKLTVQGRIADAIERLDSLALKFEADPNIKPEKQEAYSSALQRAYGVIDGYARGLEAFNPPPAPAAEPAPQPNIADRILGEDSAKLGQAYAQANIAQQQMAAQQEQASAIEQQAAMEEQAVAEQKGAVDARKQAITDAKLAQQEAALQPKQYDPVQLGLARTAILNEIASDPKLLGKRTPEFLKRLKTIDAFKDNALPTPEEIQRLEKADKDAIEIGASAAQGEVFEEVSTPRKLNKKQQTALQRIGSVKSARPTADSAALEALVKDVTAKFEALAGSLSDGFLPQLDKIIENLDAMTVKRGADVATRVAEVKKVQQALAQIEQTAALPAGTQMALPMQTPAAPAPKAKTAPESAAAPAAEEQLDFFTEKAKPTKAAARETNEQVRERIDDLVTRNAKGDANTLQKQMQLRRLERVVGRKGISNRDLNGVIDSIINPETAPADAKALVDTAIELAGPAPTLAAPRETTEASPAPAEEAESAVLDEANPGVNPDDAAFMPLSPEARVRARERGLGDALKLWTAGWKNPPVIELFDPNNPRDPRAAEFYKFAPFAGLYDRETKKVFMNIYAFENAEQFGGTLYHEALGHYGLDQLYGKRRNDVLMQIYRGNPEVRREAAALQKQSGVSLGSDIANQLYYTEEVLVNRFNKGELELSPTFWQKIRDLITEFARKMGMPARKYTNAELIATLHAARDAVINGRPPIAPGPTRPTFGQRFAAQPLATPAAAESQSRAILRAFEKKGLPDWMASIAITANDMRLKAQMGLMFGRDLVDYAKGLGVPSYERYFDILQQVQSTARDYITQLDQIMVDTGRMAPTAKEELNKYLRKATMGKKWGYQPTWPDAPQVTVDPDAEKDWNALTPEVRAMADRVFAYGYKSRLDLQKAVTDYIEKETAGDLANALTADERKSIEQRKQRQIKLFNKTVPRLEGPYAPLARFGNYMTISKSKTFRDLEAQVKQNPKDGDLQSQLFELRADPKHYAVFFRDSLGEAELKAKEMDAKPEFAGTKSEAAERTTAFEQIGDPPLLQMQKLKDMVEGELGKNDKFGRETSRAITELVRDLYIKSLADTSARKHDAYRENIEGADDNMLRAFAQKGRSDANFIAQIKDQFEMGEVLQTIIAEGNVRDGMFADRKRVVGEITRRHVAAMTPDNTPWQDKAMAVSSFFHLATSPRYYIMNAMQTWMFAAPVMAGRYGVGAYQSLASTYYELMPVFRGDGFWKGKVDMSAVGKTEAERTALKKVQNKGLLEAGMQYDAGYWEATGDGSVTLARANHMFRTVSGQIEFINRTTAGLTAFRLEMARTNNVARAERAMQDVISQTQFDYSKANAPSLFNALPKVMTQFKKYQLGQIALQGRLIYNAVKGASPEEKAVARKSLGYMYTQLALVAGVAGVPAMQLIGVIADAIFGEEDDPLDGEEFLESLLGKTLYRGVPTAAGFEMSGLGLGALLNPFPFVEYGELTTREGLYKNAFSMIGPIAGVAEKQVKAYEAAQSGEWLRAAGEALPSGITNAVRAFELATRGLEKANGDMLMEPDAMLALIRAVGFTPSEIRDAQITNARKIQHEEYFKGRQSGLTRAYTQAAKAKDTTTQAEVVAQWKNLQEAKKRAGLKPTPLTTLLTSPQKQRQREADTVGGVQTTRANRVFVERAGIE